MQRSHILTQITEKLEQDSTNKTILESIIPSINRLTGQVSAFEGTINMPHANVADHAKRIKTNGALLQREITTATNGIINKAAGAIYDLNKQVERKAGFGTGEGSNAAEIRQAVLALSSQQKLKLIAKKDPIIISALMSSHELLHGVPSEPLQSTIEAMKWDSSPTEMKELEQLDNIIEMNSEITRQAEAAVTAALEPNHINEVLKTAESAETAHNEFISSLGA